MTKLIATAAIFLCSGIVWLPAGYALGEKRPVSAQRFYDESGFARVELRGAQP